MKPALLISALFSFAASAVPFDLPASLTKKLLGDQESKGSIAGGALSSESLDNSIDPDSYRVGGGDVFQVAIVGLPSQEYTNTVNSDGNIYIPDVGEIVLGKITLTEAIKKIQEAFGTSLKKRYKVYVALKRVKRPVITVVGSIASPGTYHMEGTQRLLDAVKMANKGMVPEEGEVNLRMVACSNGDTTGYFDLLRYIAGGDPSQNPYLYPGDRIEIRSMDGSICVGGPISGPVQGRIPLVPGESAKDVIEMLSVKSSADTSYFLYGKRDRPIRKVPRSEASNLILEDNDVLTIPSLENYGAQDTVYVSGEVVRPGTYPITWGKTTATELIEFAGGPTAQASPDRAFVIRSNKIILPGAAYLESKGSTVPIGFKSFLPSTQLVRPEINSSLNDLVAYGDYAVIRLADYPEGKVTLESGDELHMPRKEDFVYVSGFVKKPGAYPYTDGKGISHYISLADGYSRKADKPNQFVMTHYNGITQIRDGAHVYEGDVIVVPASVENKRLSTVWLPLIQTMATILSLVITVVAINNARNP